MELILKVQCSGLYVEYQWMPAVCCCGYSNLWLKSLLNVSPRLYEEKRRLEGSLAYPSYPAGRANFWYISLQNLTSCLHEKHRLAGSSFVDGRAILLAVPTRLHIKHFSSLSRINSVKHARALLLALDSGTGASFCSHINARYSWLCWAGDLLFRDDFPPYKQDLGFMTTIVNLKP